MPACLVENALEVRLCRDQSYPAGRGIFFKRFTTYESGREIGRSGREPIKLLEFRCTKRQVTGGLADNHEGHRRWQSEPSGAANWNRTHKDMKMAGLGSRNQ